MEYSRVSHVVKNPDLSIIVQQDAVSSPDSQAECRSGLSRLSLFCLGRNFSYSGLFWGNYYLTSLDEREEMTAQTSWKIGERCIWKKVVYEGKVIVFDVWVCLQLSCCLHPDSLKIQYMFTVDYNFYTLASILSLFVSSKEADCLIPMVLLLHIVLILWPVCW